MLPLTLTPELRLYLLTGLALCSLATLNLAGAVHNRYLDDRGTPMLPVYVALGAAVTAGGLLVQGPDVLWRAAPSLPPPWRPAAVIAAGGAVALAATAGDRAVLRALARRRATGRGGPGRGGHGPGAAPGREAVAAPSRQERDGAWRPSARDRRLPAGPAWTLSAAVVEETVFRGVWYDVALRAHAPVLRLAALALGVLAFGLAHLFFGWNQVLAKLPLSLAATVAVAVTGTVLAPVLGHVLFNLRAWRHHRAASRARTEGAR